MDGEERDGGRKTNESVCCFFHSGLLMFKGRGREREGGRERFKWHEDYFPVAISLLRTR